MSVVMICYGPASMPYLVIDGEYLESYDPEAFGGRGDAKFTTDISRAMTFPSLFEAMELWRTVPKSRPCRQDGKAKSAAYRLSCRGQTIGRERMSRVTKFVISSSGHGGGRGFVAHFGLPGDAALRTVREAHSKGVATFPSAAEAEVNAARVLLSVLNASPVVQQFVSGRGREAVVERPARWRAADKLFKAKP